MSGPFNVPYPNRPTPTMEGSASTLQSMLMRLPQHIAAGIQGYDMGRRMELERDLAAGMKSMDFTRQGNEIAAAYNTDLAAVAKNPELDAAARNTMVETIVAKHQEKYSGLYNTFAQDKDFAEFTGRSGVPDTIGKFMPWSAKVTPGSLDWMADVYAKHGFVEEAAKFKQLGTDYQTKLEEIELRRRGGDLDERRVKLAEDEYAARPKEKRERYSTIAGDQQVEFERD